MGGEKGQLYTDRVVLNLTFDLTHQGGGSMDQSKRSIPT